VIPSHLGGFNLASIIVHPENQHFFEQLHLRFPKTFRAEMLAIADAWNNLALKEALPLAHGNMIAIALELPGGDVLFNPSPETVLQQGGSLLVIGKVGHP
jgi:voltage-gated potassium channel